jgi:hypothetical protein
VPERGAVDQRHAEDLDDHFQREPIRERLDDVDFFTLAKPIEQIVRDRLDPWLELRDRTGLEGAGDQLPQLSVPRLVAREHPQRRIAAAASWCATPRYRGPAVSVGSDSSSRIASVSTTSQAGRSNGNRTRCTGPDCRRDFMTACGSR